MVWAFIWNIVLNSITLVLAVVVTSKAPTHFEALVFLMALIAYHRLLWFIDSGHEDNRQRILIIMGWFCRLENSIKRKQPKNAELRAWLAGLYSADEMISLKDVIGTHAKKRRNAFWIHAVTEVLLMLAVIGILMT